MDIVAFLILILLISIKLKVGIPTKVSIRS
ncbi:hypothetical protein SRABI27_00042 [Pedobacter sp. Bi27]|nr:hypothetical protein SRABI126_00043 [Pedobacter sp. Bi126]CAH0131310.1 hypothetical protein SRABI27_00042 [Pedobacter sp. Bi27]CAH0227554.1 hypothetical protein SRABI36_02638 [Pedobacter sp. Bi36]